MATKSFRSSRMPNHQGIRTWSSPNLRTLLGAWSSPNLRTLLGACVVDLQFCFLACLLLWSGLVWCAVCLDICWFVCSLAPLHASRACPCCVSLLSTVAFCMLALIRGQIL
uniref:Uncharacterized protein n=1 Tax=Arundo donax TaxID=35708 RepID=A0A0A9EAJ6_ARUDO